MYQEIERKWLIDNLPDIEQEKAIPYERHFLYNHHGIEIRIQKKGEKYEWERKVESSSLGRDSLKYEITEAEFEFFRQYSVTSIKRESYIVESSPPISIKVYDGEHEGLIRVEVEFSSEGEAKKYTPPTWFGPEITNLPLGRDKELSQLNRKEVEHQIASLNSQ